MATDEKIDRLVILIVSGRQSGDLMDSLRKENFYFTQIDNMGGIVQESVESLFIGLPAARLPALLALTRRCCKPQKEYVPAQIAVHPVSLPTPMIEAQVGGAMVCVMNVDRFEQL